MIGIKYVGQKAKHTDFLYGTNLTWMPDQVHNVDDSIAQKMLAHTDVYAEAKAAAVTGTAAPFGRSNITTEENQ